MWKRLPAVCQGGSSVAWMPRLLLDADADQGIGRGACVERADHGAGREIELGYVRRVIIDGPESAALAEIDTRPERRLSRASIRLCDATVDVETNDDLSARHQDAAVGKHAKVLCEPPGERRGVEA